MSINAELLERRTAAVARGVASAFPIFARRAENAELWDEDGRRYIDFAGGIAVLGVGHRHPRVMAAVAEQMAAFTHTSFQVVGYRSYVALCERLNGLAPIAGEVRSVLFTTGAEAVENAVKIARAATRRSVVLAFAGGFHGRTALTQALTGKVRPYKGATATPIAGIYHLPFPVEHDGTGIEDTFAALRMLFAADVEPSEVAAIVIEPVQGEGGFHVAPPALLRALRALCDEHGIVLIADEVQTGFARTGRMFAIEHSGVEPDLIAVAKSVAGGLPLSGVIGKAALMDAIPPGGLGGTYGGSPLACAAALAVLDIIADEALIERSGAIGELLVARLEAMSRRDDLRPIGNIRGLGAMVGCDLLAARGAPAAEPEAARAVAARALDAGLILLSCGAHGETLRMLAPLTASTAIIEEGLDAIERALAPG